MWKNVSICLKMKPFGLNNLSLKVSPSECLFKKDQYWQRQSFKRWESLCDMKCISVYGEIMVGSGTGCFKKWLREFWGLYCTVNYTGLDITLLGNVLFWSFFTKTKQDQMPISDTQYPCQNLHSMLVKIFGPTILLVTFLRHPVLCSFYFLVVHLIFISSKEVSLVSFKIDKKTSLTFEISDQTSMKRIRW